MGRRDWGGGYAAKVKVMRAECYRLLLHRWKHFHRLYSLSLSLSFVFSSMLGFLSVRCFSFRWFSSILVGYFLLLRLRVNDVIANTVAHNETLCYTTARSWSLFSSFFSLGTGKRGFPFYCVSIYFDLFFLLFLKFYATRVWFFKL